MRNLAAIAAREAQVLKDTIDKLVVEYRELYGLEYVAPVKFKNWQEVLASQRKVKK